MSNPVTDHWVKVNRHERTAQSMPRIIKKVPFIRQVITERDQVWAYIIENNKPRYYFMYSFFIDKRYKVLEAVYKTTIEA